MSQPDLSLNDFKPKPRLSVKTTEVLKPRFPVIDAILPFLVPGMLIGGIWQTLTYLPIRNRDYRLYAFSKIVQAAV